MVSRLEDVALFGRGSRRQLTNTHSKFSSSAFTDAVACRIPSSMNALQTMRRPLVWRLRDLRPEYGLAPSTTWKQIGLGLWPPAIRLTGKSVGFVAAECDQVIQARIRGESDEAIKQLVRELVAARKTARIEEA